MAVACPITLLKLADVDALKLETHVQNMSWTVQVWLTLRLLAKHMETDEEEKHVTPARNLHNAALARKATCDLKPGPANSLLISQVCRIAKLFAKHLKVPEQQKHLQEHMVGIGCGTPNRLLKLADMDALKLDRLRLLVLDVQLDAKQR